LVLDRNFYWNSCKTQQSHGQVVCDLSSLVEMNVISEKLTTVKWKNKCKTSN